ncbi:hypothetical protein PV328_003132 [Microctonus aethiopoides]|uniref:RAP domain-containing protein n=1 Tax=Microctonus aethiopoides TaxID=144406 RepID=A0AA39F7R1_9HYME|nr:hypothetical protein PV328_003132 [Microctonus aethiopoides]
MLKLIGTLRNGSSRLGSRTSTWCIPNHQIVSTCSSVATASQVNNEKVTEPKSEDSTNVRMKSKYSRINLIFDSLSEDNDYIKVSQSKELKMVEELLRSVDKKDINRKHALEIIDTLRKWVENGKIKFKDFEGNPRYEKLCGILGRNVNNYKGMNFRQNNQYDSSITSEAYEFDQLQESYSNMSTISTDQAIKVLSGLATKQRRVKPVLRAIATNIHQSKRTLSIKNIADILYSMACLNFPDQVLLEKLCKDLQESLHTVHQSPIIGSILTSFGMLRYRNDKMLNMISEWVVQSKDILRTQDLCALLMTLATVGFTPTNSETLIKDLVSTLSETDMIKSSEWLDVVWALTILDQVTPEQLQTVLNTGFIEKLADPIEVPLVKKHKLLNVNAAAKFLFKNYSGPCLPPDSPVFDALIVKSKDKQVFVKAVTDALANLFPSREHFRINVDNGTGFLLDVEFFMNEKCGPLSIEKISNDTNALRIGIIANYYHDYCIGEQHLLGPVLLHYRLLQAQGYRLLDISHQDFHTDDKLLKRITYINDRIKSIVK